MPLLKQIRGVLVRNNDTDRTTLNNDTVTAPSQFPDSGDGPWPLSDFWQIVTDGSFQNSSVNEYTLDWDKPNGGVDRVEEQTRTDELRSMTDYFFSISYKIPSATFINDPNAEIVHLQIHGAFGSPSFSIRSQNGRWMYDMIWNSDGSGQTENRMRFSEGNPPKDTVLKRIFRVKRDTDINGRITIWDGVTNEILEAKNPDTGEAWQVPESFSPSLYGKYLKGRQPSGGVNYPLPMQIAGVTLMDWWGKSEKPDHTPYWKWGFYRASRPSSPAENLKIKKLLVGDIAFFRLDSDETHEDAYRALSIGNTIPSEEYRPLDFTMNDTDTFTISVTSTSGGSVSQSPIGSPLPENQLVTLTATANTGFRFDRYRDTNTLELISTSSIYTFNLTQNRSIQAVFVTTQGIRFRARKQPIT
jgi:hypothetical protein